MTCVKCRCGRHSIGAPGDGLRRRLATIVQDGIMLRFALASLRSRRLRPSRLTSRVHRVEYQDYHCRFGGGRDGGCAAAAANAESSSACAHVEVFRRCIVSRCGIGLRRICPCCHCVRPTAGPGIMSVLRTLLCRPMPAELRIERNAAPTRWTRTPTRRGPLLLLFPYQ